MKAWGWQRDKCKGRRPKQFENIMSRKNWLKHGREMEIVFKCVLYAFYFDSGSPCAAHVVGPRERVGLGPRERVGLGPRERVGLGPM